MAEYVERKAAYALAKKICDAIRNREYHPATFGHLILDWIDDLPAADVAPVRHGRWIEHHDTKFGRKLNNCIECNCCEVWFSADEMMRRSYCPNCGAKMDGK